MLTVALAYTLHPRTNGAPTGLTIVFPHQLASQPFRSVQDAFLHRFLPAVGPFSRKLLPKVYILHTEREKMRKYRYLSSFTIHFRKR